MRHQFSKSLSVNRLILVGLIVIGTRFASPLLADDWPSWRGKDGSGFSSENNIPVHWDSKTNVLWRKPTPGVGHSSPIIWEDNIFLTYANVESQTRHVMAIERETGETRWDVVVAKGPIEEMHRDNSPASATPTTDGEHLFVVFCVSGTLKVAALDFTGEMQWETTVGTFESQHGFCTALVLETGKLLLSGLQDGSDAFVAAIDSRNGSVLWKVPREKHTRSFSTPCVVQIQGSPAMILSGASQTIAYDCETGKTLWTLDGPASKTVSSIVVAEELGLAFVCGGRDGQFYAIRYDQLISDSDSAADRLIAWSETKGIPYVNSPYYQAGLLHIVSDDGIYRCYDAETGKMHVNKRIATKVDSSMIGWGDLVYLTDAEGKTSVIRNSPKFELLAENDLQEPIVASAAISNGDLVFRSTSHLYLIRNHE